VHSTVHRRLASKIYSRTAGSAIRFNILTAMYSILSFATRILACRFQGIDDVAEFSEKNNNSPGQSTAKSSACGTDTVDRNERGLAQSSRIISLVEQVDSEASLSQRALTTAWQTCDSKLQHTSKTCVYCQADQGSRLQSAKLQDGLYITESKLDLENIELCDLHRRNVNARMRSKSDLSLISSVTDSSC
jgi:hypothetical protein